MTIACDASDSLDARRTLSFIKVDPRSVVTESHGAIGPSVFPFPFVSAGKKCILTSRDKYVLDRVEEMLQSGGWNEY
jgi:hypothetical protein